jgi:hypothetical protein
MLCSLARWQLSSALDRRGERPRPGAAHLARCASCQEFARRLESLHGRLTATARSAPRPALVPRRRWLFPALASCALAVAAGAALYLLMPGLPARAVAAPLAVAPEATPPAETAEPAVTAPADTETGGDPGDGSGALTGRDPGAQVSTSRERDLLGRLSVLYTAPPRLRAELDALASDGRRGALAILGLGGVGPGDERIR